MNFEAVDKISSPIVTKLLDQIKNSYATKQLLIITRYIVTNGKSINSKDGLIDLKT